MIAANIEQLLYDTFSRDAARLLPESSSADPPAGDASQRSDRRSRVMEIAQQEPQFARVKRSSARANPLDRDAPY